MIQSIDTLGLRVESVLPVPHKIDVNVNSQIIINFNAELNTESIVGSFIVLIDRKGLYTGGEIDLSLYEALKGTLTYKDKSIIFTPSNQLDKYCRYIIYVKKNSIKNIFGRVMLTDFTSYFDTEVLATIKPTQIIVPVCNSILTSLEKVEIENVNSDKYILQISKQKTFENVVLDKVFDNNTIEEDFNIGNGLYYIRAKAVNGDFGDVSVFTIKSHINTITTDQDLDEDYIYMPIDNEEVELIGNFPEGINAHEKSNIVYMKFKGEIDISDIDFYESQVYGELSDEEDVGTIKEHGELDGSYSIAYDSEADETYVFFIPNSI